MHITTRTALLGAVGLSLAACQAEPAASPTQTAAPTVSARVAQSPAPASRPSGTAQPSLDLQGLTRGEWNAAELRGELGCSFSRAPMDDPLLIAFSFVDDEAVSEAVVKLKGQVLKLTTVSKGGFNALGGGARFAGPGGLFVTIVRTADEPLPEDPLVAMESPRYPALLVVSRGGRELSIDGFWECGP